MTLNISLLFISYDSAEHILGALRSLEQNGEIANEIIVVNNMPEDNKLDHLLSGYSQLQLVQNSDNKGFSYAVNRGMEHVSNELILICNPDIIFHTGILTRLSLLMEANDNIGVVGPKILDPNFSIQASARSFPTWKTLFFNRYSILGRLLPNSQTLKKYLYPTESNASLMEVDWVSASCMLVRRQAFLEAGKFDEGYFLFMEDVDFCWRIKKDTGYKVCYYRDVSVIHQIGISKETDDVQLIRHRHRSIRRFIDRYFNKQPALIRTIGKGLIRIRELWKILSVGMRKK